MRLVVDANALFSALIRKSTARKLFSDPRLELFAPEFLLEEFGKHILEVLKKSRLPHQAFLDNAHRLLKRIRFVDNAQLLAFSEASFLLVTDEKDAVYVACALAINAEIWSNDKHFQTNRIKVLTTQDVMEKLYG